MTGSIPTSPHVGGRSMLTALQDSHSRSIFIPLASFVGCIDRSLATPLVTFTPDGGRIMSSPLASFVHGSRRSRLH